MKWSDAFWKGLDWTLGGGGLILAIVLTLTFSWVVFDFATCKDETPEEVPEAYILVKQGAVLPLWDYQMLPMRDCAWCHRTVNLNRHHVVPQAANPALRDVRENLVVLCRDCHFVLGHRCNWKQYNPDVLYICTHFTNCVRSADTRYALTNETERAEPPVEQPAAETNGNIDAERILHVTNDVPESMRPALERILRSGN